MKVFVIVSLHSYINSHGNLYFCTAIVFKVGFMYVYEQVYCQLKFLYYFGQTTVGELLIMV